MKLHHFLSLFTFCLFISNHALTQSHYIGLKGGTTLSDWSLSPNTLVPTEIDYVLGGTAGVFYQLEFQNRWAFQTGFNFSQYGQKAILTDVLGNNTGTLASLFNYGEFSLIQKRKFGKGKLQLNPFVGQKIGYLFSLSSRFVFTQPNSDFVITANSNSFSSFRVVRAIEFIGLAGAELALLTKKGYWFVDMRLNWGIGQVIETEFNTTTNYSWEWNIGYAWNIYNQN